MPREINDKETAWSLVQAYAGLKEDDEETSDAAWVEGTTDSVYVVATPSGGAQTVRLQLKSDWKESLSDEELLEEIKSQQKQ
jgi:hypothetical protein